MNLKSKRRFLLIPVLLARIKSPVRWVRETGIYDTRQPGKTRP